ncbi:PilN domain-containing protein [Roseimaritima ulvae]|uniref:Fimbrial assembly protein (PilN) n=1 Tax=Roseimaritima ulvae TaxID=980254 RepID=A0A5B9R9I2_9BACT|nr:PilN domain-containing protein [Roseimaritima ulvae]QEG43483.1 Fimbrial assembly protein (PilN) [Roseimaritima ulvae]
MQVNLLPEPLQLQRLLRSRLKTWTVMWTVCLLLAVGFCAYGGWQLRRQQRRGLAVQQHIEPLQQQRQRTARLKVELAKLHAQTSATENLLPPDLTLPLLAVLSQSTADVEGDIQTLRLAMQSMRPRPTSPPTHRTPRPSLVSTTSANADPPVRLQVTLHGSASSDQAVSQFVSRLRGYAIFTKVELKSSSETSSTGQGTRAFHLELVH